MALFSLPNLLVILKVGWQLQFKFLISDGQVWTEWTILRLFPDWHFFVLVKDYFEFYFKEIYSNVLFVITFLIMNFFFEMLEWKADWTRILH